MIALITGASSGIGRDMARILNNLNYDIIIPGWNIKMARFLSKLSPDTISTKICYHMQSKKIQ